MKQHVADAMAPGDHGSTFAGNPLVCHAANAVMDVIADPAFLAGKLSQWFHLLAQQYRHRPAEQMHREWHWQLQHNCNIAAGARLASCTRGGHRTQAPCDAWCAGVRHKGERLREGLKAAFKDQGHVQEVRGQGLICGIQLDTVGP